MYVSVVCDFEDPSLCGYQQAVNDDFDWTWHSGGTTSVSTGPTADHTYGTLDGRSLCNLLLLQCTRMWLAASSEQLDFACCWNYLFAEGLTSVSSIRLYLWDISYVFIPRAYAEIHTIKNLSFSFAVLRNR